MKKPEVLITELSRKINIYLLSSADKLEELELKLYDEINEFLNTNIMFWGELNVGDFHSAALFINHTLIRYAYFVEEATGHIFNVPIRKCVRFDITEYMLPKIFKAGKYILGELTITVDKSGHFTYDRPKAENVFYKDLLKDSRFNTSSDFSSIANELTGISCPLLIALDDTRNHYTVAGTATIRSLDVSTLIVKIQPAIGSVDLSSALSRTTLGLLQRDQRDQLAIVVSLSTGFTGSADLPLTETGVAYNGDDYYIVKPIKHRAGLATLYPTTHSELDSVNGEDLKFYYLRENYLREPQ